MRQRRFDEALAYFEAANDREESAGVHYMMGSIYLAKGQADLAVEHLEKTLALEPSNAQALVQLTKTYALGNQREKALQTVRRLLEIAPDHPEGRGLLDALSQNTES